MTTIKSVIRKHAKELIGISLVILTLIMLVNSYSLLKISKELDSVVEKGAPEPVSINIVSLQSSCTECPSLDAELTALKNENVKVEKESSAAGNEITSLVSKYGIKRLPAFIVTGEIDDLDLTGYRKAEDALVLETANVPYQDASSGQVLGLVKTILVLESSCEDCPDLRTVIAGFQAADVAISERKTYLTDEAAEIIAAYNITRLPALILSSEFSEYPLSQVWDRLGHMADDGSYVLDLPSPPYYDLATKEIMGLVEFTELIDASCTECYNVSEVHLPILQGFGVVLKEQKSVDISSSEGKQLIEKYNITSIPTMVLSSEASDYPALVNAWEPVGSVEDDGSLVFRENEVLDLVYKDLVSGEVINPASA